MMCGCLRHRKQGRAIGILESVTPCPGANTHFASMARIIAMLHDALI